MFMISFVLMLLTFSRKDAESCLQFSRLKPISKYAPACYTYY